jgi:DNA-directed RNA polymerase specialized sigma24 family protein
MIDSAAMVRAHLAALVSMGDSLTPLTRAQAVAVAFAAIRAEAAAIDAAGVATDAEMGLEMRLSLAGVRAVHEAQAGMIDRSLLIQRIEALPQKQQRAYSLRYEHGMCDAQIAESLGIDEDAVAALMLRALLRLTGVSDDT